MIKVVEGGVGCGRRCWRRCWFVGCDLVVEGSEEDGFEANDKGDFKVSGISHLIKSVKETWAENFTLLVDKSTVHVDPQPLLWQI